MKVVYLAIGDRRGAVERIFGAYSDEGKAKARLEAVRKTAGCDQYFLHELILDKDTEDYI